MIVFSKNESRGYVMQYPVFVQSHSNHQFVASVVGFPNCVAEGQTREEAIAKVKSAIEAQLSQGELIVVEVVSKSDPSLPNPWLKYMGIFADDPTFDDFLEEVSAYRRQMDTPEIEFPGHVLS
ncbi:MAG TPA: type II toxin-antitoxin system HicB family antitoxin [Acidobacteriota bacterium]|nr:type II toxin-antitoxin system HicB family antitoxin [Acidobacteriota bacterium]